jgi:sporulation protein YlmC with PRC-barrel domain
MDNPVPPQNEGPDNDDQSQKLMESGPVYLEQGDGSPVEVMRGMTILTKEGQEAGKVAAVVVDNYDQKVTHLVLGRLHLRPDYRLVPVNLVEQVTGDEVLLYISGPVVESLPVRQAS